MPNEVKFWEFLESFPFYPKAANVYYTLLKEKITKFEPDSVVDKSCSVLVENMTKLLSNPAVNDQVLYQLPTIFHVNS